MTRHVLIALMTVVCWTRLGGSAGSSDDNLTCVISYQAWDLPERLQVSWSVPYITAEHEELDINVTRFMVMLGNEDPCPEVSLTSCAWIQGSMTFDHEFMLYVTITDKNSTMVYYKQEWFIDPDNCKKPPAVSHVTADVINSTCVDVRWWYDRETMCFTSPFYKITLSPEHGTELTANTTLKDSCNASRTFCDLSPFTKYVITIEAKFVNFLDQASGHFSDNKTTFFTTPEDVPAGVPEMVLGGFTVVNDECATGNIRLVRLFWMDVPTHLKNGVITRFLIEIIPSYGNHDNTSTDGSRYNSVVVLRCDMTYNIELRAETSAGISPIYSSVFIPSSGQAIKDALEDVIPVISDDRFNVYWVDKSEPKNPLEERKVFWCFNSADSQCLSPINWTTVSTNSTSVTVPVQHGMAAYKYLIGVSYGDRGITWAKCHYTQLGDPHPPTGLRVESDKTMPEGSMTVYWENQPCESRVPGPYIHQFVISYCKVSDRNENTCNDAPLQVVVSNRRHSFSLGNLDAGAKYRVCVQTEGMSSTYSNPSCINGQPTDHYTFWSQRAIVICVIFATLLLFCAIYGGIKCNKHLHRKFRTLIEERFRISLPKTNEELELVDSTL